MHIESHRPQGIGVDDESTKDQILKGYQEDDELQYRGNGCISKTYDPVVLSKRPIVQRNTLITVNRLVWMGLPEHAHIMSGRLGEIEPVTVKGISPRLIETVTPDVQKAIQDAKDEINVAEEMDEINIYSRALGLLLWVRD